MIDLTPDLRLLGAPSETYRRIAGAHGGAPSRTWLRAFARAAALAGATGISTAVLATGRITWSLALSGVLCWSFIALLQTITALAAIGRAGSLPGWPRTMELFFLGHAAWSLWLLLVAALSFVAPGVRQNALALSAVIPAGWTAVVIYAFFRRVLTLAPRQAAARTIIHQSLTYLVILTYVAWAVQLWPRVIGERVP